MHRVLKALVTKLDRETRLSIGARADGLMRGVRYEAEKQSRNYTEASAAGWSMERIEVICCLNAFYQIVLGPLTAATRNELSVGLVRNIPIWYGEKVRVSNEEAMLLKACHNKFTAIMQELGIDFWCLQSAYSNDLLYKLAHPLRKHD